MFLFLLGFFIFLFMTPYHLIFAFNFRNSFVVFSIQFIVDSPAEIMAEAGRRRLETLFFNKTFFRIVSLLFLVHVGRSLDFKNNALHSLINNIQRARESVRLLRESESGTEDILTLLDIANSVANKKQLKLFQQFLQEAVDEAHSQKVEKAAKTNAYTQLINVQIFHYLPKIQTMKSEDSLIRRMDETMEKIFRVISQNFLLHKDLYTGKANETETKLENALMDLNSQLKIHDPV